MYVLIQVTHITYSKSISFYSIYPTSTFPCPIYPLSTSHYLSYEYLTLSKACSTLEGFLTFIAVLLLSL